MKKLLSVVLSASALLSATVFAETDTVTPVHSEWAKSEISAASEIGLTNAENLYYFTNPITREEFCELIYSYCTVFSSINTISDAENPFTDTDNLHIQALYQIGIVTGKSETEFSPDDCLTREEAAVILFRLLNATNTNWNSTEEYFDFSDTEQISDWAFNAVFHMKETGIMEGVGNKTFAPQEPFSTEQAIATLVRMSRVKENEVFDNAENMSASQIEELQTSVNNGHSPWRIDYNEVIKAFLASKGESIDGEIIASESTDTAFKGEYHIENNMYEFELYKPADKGEHGIWIVKSYSKK